MSYYNDLYNTKINTNTNLDNLDKLWGDMWVKNSKIMSSMFPLNEGYSSEQNREQTDKIRVFDNQVNYNTINSQNIALTTILQNMNALYSTDDQKSLYQSAQNTTLNTAIYVLYFIYFALLIVIAFILVFNLPTIDIYFRAAIMAAFILYPFIISYIEMILYISGLYLYSILNGNVYTNGSW